jgi:gamma-glutamylcysteine synthetase
MWLYPAIGIAAAIALLFSLSIALNHQDGEEPSLVAQTDSTRVTPQTPNTQHLMNDTLKKVKEMIQMTKTPRHYMAKRDKQTKPIAEPEVIDAADLAEQVIAEEERRFAMEMMLRMNGSLQPDYQEMTREIRQRGERMNRQVEMAVNDDKY